MGTVSINKGFLKVNQFYNLLKVKSKKNYLNNLFLDVSKSFGKNDFFSLRSRLNLAL